ncbi:TLD-domain-containing protein [Cryphonectria parasitica EP155]|uniref:Oxidation resistance protein 1 n=1 Tax=Cryphonectria parasitica (strain ATCC 38755 / EP155) TaxID=660469 RepID=A0A9P5CLW9_CRYP1|nr:TLD-domain-containing protein [Cryphonectria parasitica EP155]KAF3763759.1 TLD-domain-containing protein [Cryphonectria parasitica EP155]
MAYHDHDRPTRHGHRSDEYSPSPSASGNATPTTAPAASSYLHGLAAGFGGLVRRFSDMTAGEQPPSLTHGASWPRLQGNGVSGVYTPPMHRSASPLRPPPLEPLELKGFRDDTTHSARLLTPVVAEEIRIMIPERQRIEDEWNLVYSLDQDGASLGTLYKKCSAYEGQRASFVLVVKDNDGGLFGAYLSDPPRPQAHYFGNGECFLWRASLLASLPPPPSEDTTNIAAARVTTIASPTRSSFPPAHVSAPPRTASPALSIGPSIRFKAFPYSGENEFYIYCEQHWLSVGGGDGHYGLWLNDSLEKGVSSRCLTFGNEPLSDEGEKFDVLGVEMWLIGRGGGVR